MEKMQQIKSTEKLNHQMRAKKAKITSLISETQTNQDKKDRVQREIELMKQKILDELEANTAEYEALKSELSLHQMGAGQTLKGGAAKTKKALELQVEHEMKGDEGNEGTLSQEEEQVSVVKKSPSISYHATCNNNPTNTTPPPPANRLIHQQGVLGYCQEEDGHPEAGG